MMSEVDNMTISILKAILCGALPVNNKWINPHELFFIFRIVKFNLSSDTGDRNSLEERHPRRIANWSGTRSH